MDSPFEITLGMICVLIMGLHANERFNTPLRNRSTTRRRLYQQARLAYIFVTVIALFVLSSLLGFWSSAFQEGKLMPMLIAAVFLMDGIPHVPFLSDIDHALLGFFKRVANIPKEVQRWAEQLKPELLRVKKDDLTKLAIFIEEESTLPNELRCHLRDEDGDQFEISEYRFTRVLKLYKHLMDMELSPKYERFFGDYAEEWKQARQDFHNFCNRSVTALELAVKYRAENVVSVHKELMEDLQQNFRASCHQRFLQLVQLLAGALVSSEPDEEGIAAALHQIGFQAAYEPAPEFPVNELSLLAIILTVYVFVAYILIQPLLVHFGAVDNGSVLTSSNPAKWALLTVVSYFAAITTTISFLLSHPRVSTRPGRPWGKYIVCAVIAAVTVGALCFSFVMIHLWLGYQNLHWALVPRMSLSIGTMCFMVALLCEADGSDSNDNFLLHLSEALIVAATMLFAALTLSPYISALFHETWVGPRKTIFTVVIPSILAAIVGFYVPHMYRMSRRYFIQSHLAGEEAHAKPPNLKIARAV
jgi:hypothetical protein